MRNVRKKHIFEKSIINTLLQEVTPKFVYRMYAEAEIIPAIINKKTIPAWI